MLLSCYRLSTKLADKTYYQVSAALQLIVILSMIYTFFNNKWMSCTYHSIAIDIHEMNSKVNSAQHCGFRANTRLDENFNSDFSHFKCLNNGIFSDQIDNSQSQILLGKKYFFML